MGEPQTLLDRVREWRRQKRSAENNEDRVQPPPFPAGCSGCECAFGRGIPLGAVDKLYVDDAAWPSYGRGPWKRVSDYRDLVALRAYLYELVDAAEYWERMIGRAIFRAEQEATEAALMKLRGEKVDDGSEPKAA